MKRKLSALLVVALAALFGLGASDFKFIFSNLDQHTEILGGFLPTYIQIGGGYTGLGLSDTDTTEIDLLVGGGYLQRKVWQDPDDGEVITEDPLVYDQAVVDWELRFSQGFGDSWVEGKDLFTLTAGYRGKVEFNLDSMVVGKMRKNGTATTSSSGEYPIRSLDTYLGNSNYTGSIYPDLNGNRQFFGNSLYLRLTLNMMEDTGVTSDGLLGKLEAEWAPLALNSALDGYADYYTLTFNLVGSKTLYELRDANGQHWFSIVMIDRANVTWTDGSAVPVTAQGPVSLGRKVRGFNTRTYNTQLTMVNNFDIRFTTPSWNDDIFARVNLFYDVGYGCGEVFNTNNEQSNFLSSAGIQMTICFWDVIDLGYQVAYLFAGDNYQKGTNTNVVGSFTFFLDF